MKAFELILVIVISLSLYLEIHLLYLGSNLLQQELSINSVAPIVVRYAVGVLTLLLKNSLVDLMIYNSTEKYITRIQKISNHPINYDQVSDLVSKIQVENTNRRAYFTLPVVNAGFDLIFIILMFFYFAPNLTILNHMARYIPILIVIFLILSLGSHWLGKRRFLSQQKYSSLLSKRLVSSYVDNNTYKGLLARKAHVSLRLATCLVNWISQSTVSIGIVISFAFLYVIQNFFDFNLDLISAKNFVFDAIFITAVYQPLLKLYRSVMKIPVGLIANKQFSVSKDAFKLDSSEYVKFQEDNAQFIIDLDVTRYQTTTGLPCPNRIVLNKGTILKVNGANGSGKSTLLWNIFKSAINTCNAVYVSQNVVAHGDNDIQASGGEYTIKALTDALTNGYDLVILDEPVNNLDNVNLSFLKSLIRETSSSLIIVDHSGKIPAAQNVYL